MMHFLCLRALGFRTVQGRTGIAAIPCMAKEARLANIFLGGRRVSVVRAFGLIQRIV
ncbi:hypothetical protein B0H19DRAFT_1185255 [Mycena capillaripes]|nr:hypothetical protein B0H19DRAFT_1185255 [Mycena capillaripes]